MAARPLPQVAMDHVDGILGDVPVLILSAVTLCVGRVPICCHNLYLFSQGTSRGFLFCIWVRVLYGMV